MARTSPRSRSSCVVRERVGWVARGEAPGETPVEEQALVERRIHVAVGGIVVMEDVIRPGAQVILDDQGRPVEWFFSTYMDEARRAWIRDLFERKGRRVTTRYVIELAPPPGTDLVP